MNMNFRVGAIVSSVALAASTQVAYACGWAVVPSALCGQTNCWLEAVSATAANDAWAVGYGGYTSGVLPFAEHWNGTMWSSVHVPTAAMASLNGVSAISASDAWAVGQTQPVGSTHQHPYVLHWNGVSWRSVHAPGPGRASNLNAVTAIAPADVWAVGQFWETRRAPGLIEHWDGMRWSVIRHPEPSPMRGIAFEGVSGSSATDVWAVGFTGCLGCNSTQTFTEHWDGSRWRVFPSPSPLIKHALQSVVTLSPTDAWAFGWQNNSPRLRTEGRSRTFPLALHWDGSTWQLVPLPNVGDSALYGSAESLHANRQQHLWAVGIASAVPGPGAPIVLESQERGWTVTYVSSSPGGLNSIGAIPRTHDLWAVGASGSGSGPYSSLIAHYSCNSATSRVRLDMSR